jgi:hypothetical protein
MAFEAVYPQVQQLCLSDKKRIWDAHGSLFVWMYIDQELVGETYGIPLATTITGFNDLPGLVDLTDQEKKSAIYCYSNTILPSFQHQGLGAILKAHWLGLAVGQGFGTVYGHARPGGSQALNAKFGAAFLDSFPNWGGCGEEYKMYRLRLRP